ncbi:NUDIX domain-containing protein [Limibaculum sp. M0105]|uniref:NUDIX domain-containing protein n=1 Tax=Thermohalobaculum xanthum TaxID=2753746 RepID=A0A8J7SEM8_9RHOB|nr:NUDIX domain-containing protein [Thermohalobaculum xanthum]MBK0399928.1 NUDIX domain-containing protein [Thermohalobaculum xanthum]
MKRIGEPWAPGRPYRDRPGAYVLALRGGRLLAVWQDDELQLPGGGIDPGESPLQALHREVREETGWLIAEPRRMAAFQRYAWLWDYGYWARKVQSIYLARAVRRLGPPSEPGHVPVWLSPADAARHLHVEGDREMVRHAIARDLI